MALVIFLGICLLIFGPLFYFLHRSDVRHTKAFSLLEEMDTLQSEYYEDIKRYNKNLDKRKITETHKKSLRINYYNKKWKPRFDEIRSKVNAIGY